MYNILENAGFSCFFDLFKLEVVGKAPIERVIQESSSVLLVLDDIVLESVAPQFELLTAMHYGIPIISVCDTRAYNIDNIIENCPNEMRWLFGLGNDEILLKCPFDATNNALFQEPAVLKVKGESRATCKTPAGVKCKHMELWHDRMMKVLNRFIEQGWAKQGRDNIILEWSPRYHEGLFGERKMFEAMKQSCSVHEEMGTSAPDHGWSFWSGDCCSVKKPLPPGKTVHVLVYQTTSAQPFYDFFAKLEGEGYLCAKYAPETAVHPEEACCVLLVLDKFMSKKFPENPMPPRDTELLKDLMLGVNILGKSMDLSNNEQSDPNKGAPLIPVTDMKAEIFVREWTVPEMVAAQKAQMFEWTDRIQEEVFLKLQRTINFHIYRSFVTSTSLQASDLRLSQSLGGGVSR